MVGAGALSPSNPTFIRSNPTFIHPLLNAEVREWFGLFTLNLRSSAKSSSVVLVCFVFIFSMRWPEISEESSGRDQFVKYRMACQVCS